jgi:hypothetical protein
MDTGTVVILVVVALAVLAATALTLKRGGSFRVGLSRDRVEVEAAGPQQQVGQRVDMANEADLSRAEFDRIVAADTDKAVDVAMLNKAKAPGLKARELVGYKDVGSSPGGPIPHR